jgi:hypothetical protein
MSNSLPNDSEMSEFQKAVGSRPKKATGYRSDHTTSVGMAEHGWTKRAIEKFLGEPDKFAQNPHYKSGPPMRLYRIERVVAVQKSPEFRDWLEQKEKRKRKALTAPQRRYESFAAKYGSWEAALPVGCEYLFNLNRYAKYKSCSDENRQDIYELKTGIVELLYRHGYSTECFEHHQQVPGARCFGCGGTGIWVRHRNEEFCRRCDGSGLYGKPKTLTFVCFRFNVGGSIYCWHQPDNSVLFYYEVTAESSTWNPGDGDEKAVALSKSKFAAAKDLLRWILDQAANAKAMAA